MAAHKFIMGHFSSFKALGCEMKPWRRVLGVLITFHVVCFGWILFRATSMKAVGEMLSQIFTNFHPEVFMQFVSGYKGVFALMVIGYVLHFMPKRSEDVLREIVTRSPLLIQAAILAIAIFIVVQFKSCLLYTSGGVRLSGRYVWIYLQPCGECFRLCDLDGADLQE